MLRLRRADNVTEIMEYGRDNMPHDAQYGEKWANLRVTHIRVGKTCINLGAGERVKVARASVMQFDFACQ